MDTLETKKATPALITTVCTAAEAARHQEYIHALNQNYDRGVTRKAPSCFVDTLPGTLYAEAALLQKNGTQVSSDTSECAIPADALSSVSTPEPEMWYPIG